MTKEVLISICGLQFETGEDENRIETITAGDYYQKNNHHYVVFDEIMDGTEKPTRNILRFNGQELQITRHGVVNVHMIFEEKKKNLTTYTTPYGTIQIGIETDEIHLAEEEKQLHLNVNYALEINYEHLADCTIDMDIRPRKESGFTI
ncbi:MAG: DUF1934 domain-containing protein [Lachnospiraceae bacterium]